MSCPICETEDYSPIIKKDELTLVRCKHCNLVFIDNLLNTFDLKNYDYYKERINLKKEAVYNPITEKRFLQLLKRIEPYRKNNEILEIGCGEGHFLSVAQSQGWQAMGVEKSFYAAKICEQFGIKAVCSDFLQMDLKNEYYDAIVALEVLEHLTLPREYIKKANSILRKDGIFILTTPNFNSITRYLLDKRWRFINKEHLVYFTPKTLKSALKNFNFKILSFKTKHITIPELLGIFNNGQSDIYKKNQSIRSTIEDNVFLSFSKNVLNELLSLTGLGESIECICQKL
jgi:2-polyprenyl-3-methyl-5-hydroxy-6-metoxy-1,4-benzoquinol methylase